MKEMREESQHFDRNEKIAQFLVANTSILNTFKELTCPKCSVELEDGEEVTLSSCGCTYHKTCIQEMFLEGDDDCIKCQEPMMKISDIEGAFGKSSSVINN